MSSDIQFAIDKAFREAGIEIPFHQTDVHLRDMDRLERALSGVPAHKLVSIAAQSGQSCWFSSL